MKKSSLGKALFLCVLVVMVAGICIALGMSAGDQEETGLQESKQLPEVPEINESEEIVSVNEVTEKGEEAAVSGEIEENGKEIPFDMTNPMPDETYAAIVSYQAKTTLQSENGLGKAQVTVTVPQLVMRSQAAGKVNEKLLAFYGDSYEYGISAAGKDMEFQQEASQEKGEDFYYDYTYETGYQVTLLNDKYLSILADGYEYAGGAHGMPFRTPFIFQLETGEQVKGEELFALSEEQFRDIKLEAYKELFVQSEEGSYWEDALSIVEEHTEFDSGYYLTEEGVTFFYEPYMLAPYAAGYVEVTVPYEQLPIV